MLTVKQLDYYVKHMMGVDDWKPSFWPGKEQEVLDIIDRNCQSKLEIMFFLGIVYYICIHGRQNGGGDYPLLLTDTVQNRKGIWIFDSWRGFPEEGPLAILVVPQYPSTEKNIYHDFGVFFGDNNSNPEWIFKYAIEIDGYGVHKDSRDKDEMRIRGLSYPVIRVFEETTEPKQWFGLVIDAYNNEIRERKRGGFMTENQGKCPKCNGSGYIERFKYRNEGKCYNCNGTGYIEISSEAIIRPVDAPVVKPVDAPVVKPVDAPVVKPVDAPVVKPVDAPVVKPVDAPVVKPISIWRKTVTRIVVAVVGFLLVAWLMTALFTSGTRNTILEGTPTNIPTLIETNTIPSTVSAEPSLDPSVAPAGSNSQPIFHGTGRDTTVEPSWYPCQERQIKGNENSKIYHIPTGEFYPKTFQNVTCFNTAAEAEAAGFRAARN